MSYTLKIPAKLLDHIALHAETQQKSTAEWMMEAILAALADDEELIGECAYEQKDAAFVAARRQS